MKKIILYSHGGSGNHGCEAIVRGTIKALNGKVDELYSYRSQEDYKYGLNKLVNIYNHTQNYSKFSLKRIYASLRIHLFHDEEYAEKITYAPLFDNVKKGDVALSIGGDNYCYNSFGEHMFLNEQLNKKGVKTVLWECSVEPSLIDDVMASDLAKYTLIVARESISYEALLKVNKNVKLCPDPAFIMPIKEIELPKEFNEDNVVGINVSPVVINCASESNIVLENFENMINYILENTNYKVALIPHVTWDFTNDNEPLKLLQRKIQNNDRVFLVKEQSAMEMKYIISRCKLFIGARTHATIAAYSSCVPTIVLGYSVKAKGIAKDLFGTDEKYVISTQNLENGTEMIEAFKWLDENKEKIRAHLNQYIPNYVSPLKNICKEIENLLD